MIRIIVALAVVLGAGIWFQASCLCAAEVMGAVPQDVNPKKIRIWFSLVLKDKVYGGDRVVGNMTVEAFEAFINRKTADRFVMVADASIVGADGVERPVASMGENMDTTILIQCENVLAINSIIRKVIMPEKK